MKHTLVAREGLPQYEQFVLAEKERLSSGHLIPTREGNAGDARNHTKSIGEMKANASGAPILPVIALIITIWLEIFPQVCYSESRKIKAGCEMRQ